MSFFRSYSDVTAAAESKPLVNSLDVAGDRPAGYDLTCDATADAALPLGGRAVAVLRRVLEWGHVDQAVIFGVLARFWGLLSGPVTMVLIASRFSPEVQGYYYTFASLLALQVFVELGLGQVIIQFASHEWSRLYLDEEGRIQGDSEALSRLVSIGRFSLRWYGAAAGILAAGLSLAGYVFFQRSGKASVVWMGPWLVLCVLTGLKPLVLQFFSLLEGCNQVSAVYRFRFIEGVIRAIFLWLPIVVGAGLWTCAISSAATLVWSVLFAVHRYGRFFQPFFSRVQGPRISWRGDLWPLQWRIAVSWLCGYLIFNLFTPVLFYYHGPVVAGQMGMTWSLVGLLSSVAAAFVMPKAPRFGMLVAQRKYVELDRLFWRIMKVAGLVTGLSAISVGVLIYVLNAFVPRLASRMLPPLPTALLLLATAVVALTLPMSTYMRAHKKEPLLGLNIVSAILIAASNIVLGRYFAALGMATGYLLINVLLVPLLVPISL